MASPYALIDEDRAANIADVLLYILSNKPEHDHSFKHPPQDHNPYLHNHIL